MFDKKQVQESIKRIDNTIIQLNGNRQTHVTLANDIALVQKVCMDYFELTELITTTQVELAKRKQEDGRTNESA